jgi:MFS transporter, SP family, arabinose:H+ symporter
LKQEQAFKSQSINSFVILVSCAAAVGGLLFGYDTAVISGAIGFLQEKFNLNATMTGWVASCLLIGCAVGAAMAGFLSDHFGRKKALVVSATIFAVSSLGCALSGTVIELVVWRMICGVGVGIASLLSPLYIAEMAPPQVRGRLVSLNQLAIVVGIFVVYFINAAIANTGEKAWNIETGWRWMLGIGIIPSAIFLILLIFIAESPRWLEQKGKRNEAIIVLKRINNDPKIAENQLNEIREAINKETSSIGQLFKSGLRLPLIIAVMLALFQQFSGSNAIMYYAPEIFKAAGSGDDSAFIQTVYIGAINLLFTLVAIWLVDKIGRKLLLVVGSISMSICMGIIGLSFYFEKANGPWMLVFILLAIASYAVSLAPVTWVILSEIFPTRIRGRAMSIATVILWLACFVVSQTFPILENSIGPAFTFWIYTVMTALTFLFVWKVVPETRNKSLEEIEKNWRKDEVTEKGTKVQA